MLEHSLSQRSLDLLACDITIANEDLPRVNE
jgi:hypothetical protein